MTERGDKANGGRGGEARRPDVGVPGKESLGAPLPKRFYKEAAVAPRAGGFAPVLDGRPIRTPGKRELVVPTEALAAALAEEWHRQGERIDPATMPLTRIVNAAIDGVAERMAEVADDIVAFAASDLLCYRAEAPAGLVRLQDAAWGPVLAWAREGLGADFRLQAGLMPIAQPPEALSAVAGALAGLDALSLAALHVLTTLSGSAVLAIAHLREVVSVEEAWAAATVDETWQAEQWGRDAEAEARAARRYAEFAAASLCLRLLRSPR